MSGFGNLKKMGTLAMPSYSIKSLKNGDSVTIKCLSEIVEKVKLDNKTREPVIDTKTGEPAVLRLVQVVDSAGVEGEMVLPFIPYQALTRAAESGPVTGRFFSLHKISSEANKTAVWRVDEMEASK